jgi:1-acyl-sn-glycerol-3-phosphate acyltransferase
MLLDPPHLPSSVLAELATAKLDPSDLGGRDPAFIERYAWPVARWLSETYFRTSFDGLAHVPDPPFITVGVHSGAPLLPDVWPVLSKCWDLFGVESPSYGLLHDVAFRIPVIGNLLIKVGGLRATPENAAKVLDAGGAVLVYPGGDAETMRPFRSRDTVDFRGRTGVVSLALAHGAPLLPIVNVGGHEVYAVLTEGRGLARRTGLKRATRISALPVVAGLPWGLWVGGMLPYLPLPARIEYLIGEPVGYPRAPELADDPVLLRDEARRLQDRMQRMTWELADRRRWPVVG